VRQDFTLLSLPDETVANLQLLTGHRADLIADRVRLINRLRDALVGICPALERAFDYSAAKGPVVLLTEYQTPAALRRTGAKQLEDWLARRAVRSAAEVAARALEAAHSQVTALPGEKRAAKLVCDFAHQLLALEEWIKDIDREIRRSASTSAPKSSNPCQAWDPPSGPSSSPSSETCPTTQTPAAWPPTPDWPRCRATPAAGPVTTTGPSATTAACDTSSTWLPKPP
jgi:hypothetical protein